MQFSILMVSKNAFLIFYNFSSLPLIFYKMIFEISVNNLRYIFGFQVLLSTFYILFKLFNNDFCSICFISYFVRFFDFFRFCLVFVFFCMVFISFTFHFPKLDYLNIYILFKIFCLLFK